MLNKLLRGFGKTTLVLVAFVVGVMASDKVKPMLDSVTSKFTK